MLHYAHHPPNRLPQPRTYSRPNRPPTPQPLLAPTAFASQIDEIDQLLRAFRLQRQRQSGYTWVPADEDTDEKMLDSESDGASGRRWSDSTESKDAGGGGGGAAFDAVGVEDVGSLVRGDGADLLGGISVDGVRDEGLGFGLGLLASSLPGGDLATVPEEGGLREEPRLVGRGEGFKSRLNVEALSQTIMSQGRDGSSFPSGVDSSLDESKSGEGFNVLPGLETAGEKTDLAHVRRVPLFCLWLTKRMTRGMKKIRQEGRRRDAEWIQELEQNDSLRQPWLTSSKDMV